MKLLSYFVLLLFFTACSTNLKKTGLKKHGFFTGQFQLDHPYPKLVFNNKTVTVKNSEGFFAIPFAPGKYTLEKVILYSKDSTIDTTYKPMITFNVVEGKITNLGSIKINLSFEKNDTKTFILNFDQKRNEKEIIEYLRSSSPKKFSNIKQSDIHEYLKINALDKFKPYYKSMEKFRILFRNDIYKNKDKYTKCYDQTGSQKSGKVIVEFVISKTGNVKKVDVIESLYADFDQCLAKAIKSIKFNIPKNFNSEAVIRFPFTFKNK
ncbi:MAG: TonB family protein [Bdellovibrionales bacterium]|nr:TonB family protein [Bdellovibrionales bacterium]